MKKRILITLFVVAFALSMITPVALADNVGEPDYNISQAAKIAAGSYRFQITVHKPAAYDAYGGINFWVRLPDDATFENVSYSLPGGSVVAPLKASNGNYAFGYKVDSNLYTSDIICTINVKYTGTSDASLTVMEIGQIVYREKGISPDELVANPNASVLLSPNAPLASFVTSVTVSPSSVGVMLGEEHQFTAEVTVVNDAPKTVDWSVTGNASSTTRISSTGLLKVAADETAARLTVTATSTHDRTQKGSADAIVYKTDRADLTSLTVANGTQTLTMTPAFAANIFLYSTTSVAYFVSGVSVTATKKYESATVTGAGNITLNEGVNTIRVTVTGDDNTTKTYTITIVRGTAEGTPGDQINVGNITPGTDVSEIAPPTPEAFPFTDVKESDWFYSDVFFMWQNRLMNGTSETTFDPNGKLTRGMVVTVLWRIQGSPSVENLDMPFSDVPNIWYHDAVKWAAEKGIVTGYPDGTYHPDNIIYRQDLALIICRYATFAGNELTAAREYAAFKDNTDISAYAKDAVETLYKSAIINGRTGNVFDPKGSATRAEFAAMLHRFLLTGLV